MEYDPGTCFSVESYKLAHQHRLTEFWWITVLCHENGVFGICVDNKGHTSQYFHVVSRPLWYILTYPAWIVCQLVGKDAWKLSMVFLCNRISSNQPSCNRCCKGISPISILYKSIAGRYWPVSVADGPITARYRFIKNASWEVSKCWNTPYSLLPDLAHSDSVDKTKKKKKKNVKASAWKMVSGW